MRQILLFNGSPHPNGNTAQALGVVEEELKLHGIATELIQLGGQPIRGCLGCRKCWERLDGHCVIASDPINAYLDKMIASDGFVIGSPVYTANVTSEVKAFIDRTNFVAKANGFLFKGKIGAPVVVGTKAGMMPAYSAIQYMFGISQMISVGSIHWNLAVGKLPGDIWKDAEGIESFRVLGRNIAELLLMKKE